MPLHKTSRRVIAVLKNSLIVGWALFLCELRAGFKYTPVLGSFLLKADTKLRVLFFKEPLRRNKTNISDK